MQFYDEKKELSDIPGWSGLHGDYSVVSLEIFQEQKVAFIYKYFDTSGWEPDDPKKYEFIYGLLYGIYINKDFYPASFDAQTKKLRSSFVPRIPDMCIPGRGQFHYKVVYLDILKQYGSFQKRLWSTSYHGYNVFNYSQSVDVGYNNNTVYVKGNLIKSDGVTNPFTDNAEVIVRYFKDLSIYSLHESLKRIEIKFKGSPINDALLCKNRIIFIKNPLCAMPAVGGPVLNVQTAKEITDIHRGDFTDIVDNDMGLVFVPLGPIIEMVKQKQEAKEDEVFCTIGKYTLLQKRHSQEHILINQELYPVYLLLNPYSQKILKLVVIANRRGWSAKRVTRNQGLVKQIRNRVFERGNESHVRTMGTFVNRIGPNHFKQNISKYASSIKHVGYLTPNQLTKKWPKSMRLYRWIDDSEAAEYKKGMSKLFTSMSTHFSPSWRWGDISNRTLLIIEVPSNTVTLPIQKYVEKGGFEVVLLPGTLTFGDRHRDKKTKIHSLHCKYTQDAYIQIDPVRELLTVSKRLENLKKNLPILFTPLHSTVAQRIPVVLSGKKRPMNPANTTTNSIGIEQIRQMWYSTNKLLGEGAFGRVKLVNGYIIKFLSMPKDAAAEYEMHHYAWNRMNSIGQSRFIPKPIQIYPMPIECSYNIQVAVNTVGTIHDVYSTLTTEQKAQVSSDFGRAICALHFAGIVHMDLHLANALMTRDYKVVIIDLGLSKKIANIPNGLNKDAVVQFVREQLKDANQQMANKWKTLKLNNKNRVTNYGLLSYAHGLPMAWRNSISSKRVIKQIDSAAFVKGYDEMASQLSLSRSKHARRPVPTTKRVKR